LSMGFLNKAVDARTSQILRNAFGQDVEFDFVAGGTLTFKTTQMEIRPFMAAVNDQGIHFVHKAQVVLSLPWSRILDSEPSSWRSSDSITVEINLPKSGQTKQFPFCYWNVADITFNNTNDQMQFRTKFTEAKLKAGFTKESLDLFSKWLKFNVDSLGPVEDFHKLNPDWHTEEIRHEYHHKFADFQDGQAFLFCMGRLACSGYVPGKMIQLAQDECNKLNMMQSELSGQSYQLKDEELEVLKITSELPWLGELVVENSSGGKPSISDQLNAFNSTSQGDDAQGASSQRGIPEDWVVGTIQTAPDEWQSPTPRSERLVAIQIRGKGDGWPSIQVWNDFHQGDSMIVFELDKFKSTGAIRVDGLNVTFSPESVEKALAVWS